MNTSYWTFLPCLFVALLRLGLSILTTTWYSNQTLIESTSAPSYGRVRRASSPKYGTCHCIWITRPTSFHSHCGPSYFSFFNIYLIWLLGVCCWHHTRSSWIKTLFIRNQQLASFCLERSCVFHFASRWPCIYLALAFVWKGHACFILPCDGPVYILHLWWAHPVLIMFKLKPVSHLIVHSCLDFWPL